MIQEIGNLKQKAFDGVLVLGIKRILVQVTFTISNIFLARLLFPSDFGTFAIITFISSIFGIFTDIGLGPALIQKKKPVKTIDLQTVFTFQLTLSVLVFTFINIVAPYIAAFYGLGDRGTILFRVYSFYFLFGPFKSTSGAILERHLGYRRLVIVEILEILIASMFTVFLAFFGLGVFSFVLGSVAGHFVGALLYFIFSPWRMRLKFSLKNFKDLAKFGLPVQINGVLSLFYGSLVLLYLGKQVGAENLGFYQFAASLSVLPLAVADIVNRVAFPLGARVQKEQDYLRKMIESSITIVSMTTLPLVFIGIASISGVVHFIYTDRWLKSVPAIYIGLFQMGFIAYSGVFGQFLLSLGKSNVLRDMAIIWVVLTWIFGPILVNKFNFLGMSLTFLIVAVSGIFLIIRLRAEIKFSITRYFLPYFVASLFAGGVVYIFKSIFEVTLLNLFLAVGFGFVSYLIIIAPFSWIFSGQLFSLLILKKRGGIR